ncbi:MAG: hypothetical protein JWM63_5218 [Gammaproteobacteria bacterium]|jgi:hypothetical protein|nr:hypothetical protein [Gammaproteobacteria bacterium]
MQYHMILQLSPAPAVESLEIPSVTRILCDSAAHGNAAGARFESAQPSTGSHEEKRFQC